MPRNVIPLPGMVQLDGDCRMQISVTGPLEDPKGQRVAVRVQPCLSESPLLIADMQIAQARALITDLTRAIEMIEPTPAPPRRWWRSREVQSIILFVVMLSGILALVFYGYATKE